ncbi:MAG: NAD-dependent epimerase/dehydratase family protein [Bacteroidetes bacterium]|nr:NAD-dependent epimerase/dehydratase family protein [Bacteroidota bacterium]
MNLITGATGLVGAHVALQLLQQHKPVVAIKRSGSDINKTKKLFSYYTSESESLFYKIKWLDADVCDIYSLLDALEGIETVYHCAGFVSFNSRDSKQMHKINAEGTANVVNACLEKNIKVLCHVSSIATLQNPDITRNIDESVYWKSSPTASDYAISKYNGEREVWRGTEEGLQAVIVNPGIILGPGFWHQSSGKLIDTSYKGNPFYTKGSSATIDARDVACCMIQLTEKQQFGKRFVLTENNYSFKDILSRVNNALGKKEPVIEAGKIMLTIGKWVDAFRSKITGNDQLITKETITSGLEQNSFNNQLIKTTLNYQFIPLQTTVAFVCQAFLNDIKK